MAVGVHSLPVVEDKNDHRRCPCGRKMDLPVPFDHDGKRCAFPHTIDPREDWGLDMN